MAYYYNDGYNRGGFWSNLPAVTKNMVLINVFMLLFTKLRPDFMMHNFALFYPTSPYFHWWQPLTHMFMHGGFSHLFFNMFTLLMFGSVLERQWGAKKFLLFYFLTGLGAAALHMGVMWLQVRYQMGLIAEGGLVAAKAMQEINVIKFTPTVGASGAIYGLLMGYAMLYPDSVMMLLFPPIPLKAKWWVAIFFVIELVTGFVSDGGNIAHFAHLGGMIFAFILIKIWKSQGKMYDYEN